MRPPPVVPSNPPKTTRPQTAYLQTSAAHEVILGTTAHHAIPLHVKTNHAGFARGTKENRRGGPGIRQGGEASASASRIVWRTTAGGRGGGSKRDGRDKGPHHNCVPPGWVVCVRFWIYLPQGDRQCEEGGVLPCGTREPRWRVPVCRVVWRALGWWDESTR